jgi:hypothetical protein
MEWYLIGFRGTLQDAFLLALSSDRTKHRNDPEVL